MECLRRYFSSCSRRKQKDWKQIEDEANSIEKLPSWDSPDDNVCMLEAFEWHVPHDGRHWQRLQHALPDLKEIGIDNILLPPGCKAMNASGNGYDVYDLYDLGEFDQKGTVATKWGTKEDLQSLAQSAEELKMGIYWDAVLNHKAGADRTEKCLAVTVDPKDRNIDLTKPQEIEAWVGFDFAGRGEAYSKMKYHWQHFNGTDYDDANRKNAIYKILAPGKDWARDVSSENGNYDYLMFANLDYSHPDVRKDVLNWIEWIGGQLPLSGMRLDAVKHYSSEFQSVLVDHIRQTVGKDWFIVSEFWSGKVVELQEYLKQVNHKVHLFDAPLCNRLSAISQTRCADLRLIFDRTLVKHEPEHAVTFVMNHDTVSFDLEHFTRVSTFLETKITKLSAKKQPSQSLEAPIPSSFKPLAYSLILLRKDGYPCVFYGDLYGISSGNSRRPSTTAEADSIHQILSKLILARKLYAYGEQRDYFTRRNCIGFVRYGNSRNPWGMACVINNGLTGSQLRMFVGKKHAGERWTDVLVEYERGGPSDKKRKTKGMVQINSKGYADFSVASMSVSVWVNVDAGGRKRFGRRFNGDIYFTR